ncbi:MAG: hypothetical protein H0U27_06375 [Nitrosopumilus sp.]|nr:hypothetical protein [Nitrosopumilus sp.]
MEGLCFIVKGKCKNIHCGFNWKWESSEPVERDNKVGKKSYDVNRRAIIAGHLSYLGFENLEKFFALLGMNPISKTMFTDLGTDEIWPMVTEELKVKLGKKRFK